MTDKEWFLSLELGKGARGKRLTFVSCGRQGPNFMVLALASKVQDLALALRVEALALTFWPSLHCMW